MQPEQAQVQPVPGGPRAVVCSRPSPGKPVCLAIVVLLAAGCATTTTPLRGPAGPNSLTCASIILRNADYELTPGDGFVLGEARVLAGEVGVTREFIEARESQDRVLEVTATAARLEIATHGLPVQRQTASAVEPSEQSLSLASDILAHCTL
ncbi:MAG: hypothetical protein HKN73_17175 [Gemmatimonadetes bacterium]|nr:hypothetical protein [Gemmatimonadota bacterium]